MADPVFTMSMFASKADLYEAKAKHYQEKCEEYKRKVDELTLHIVEEREFQTDLADGGSEMKRERTGMVTAYNEVIFMMRTLEL